MILQWLSTAGAREEPSLTTSGHFAMDWKAKVIALASKSAAYARLTESEWAELRRSRSGGARFSLVFLHDVARSAKARSLVLIAIDDAELRIGIVSSVQAIGTLHSRVLFDLVQIVSPNSLNVLVHRLATIRSRAPVRRLIDQAAPLVALSEKLREAVFTILTEESENEASFSPILARLDRPPRFDGMRALQADAISLALKAFGATDGASSVSFVGKGSLLEGTRLLEDAVIEHEARWVRGWKLDDSDVTGRAVFTKRDARLVVYTANKRPLEKLLGVDLIYLNEQRGSLVMVQYKMMEASTSTNNVRELHLGGRAYEHGDSKEPIQVEPKEWITPIDAQFTEEMKRMARFDQDLSASGAYRLDSGAFYFKLVRRNASTNSSAIVISLRHMSKLIEDGEASGPRGGLRVSYEGLGGHYLRGDGFIELIRSGYIGTRDATTIHLRALIDAALANHRGVVAAVQSALS